MRVRIHKSRNYDSVFIADHRRARILADQLIIWANIGNPFAHHCDSSAPDVAEGPHRQDMAYADQRNGLAHRVSFAYRRHETAQFSTHPTRKNRMIPMMVRTATVANRPAVSPRFSKCSIR